MRYVSKEEIEKVGEVVVTGEDVKDLESELNVVESMLQYYSRINSVEIVSWKLSKVLDGSMTSGVDLIVLFRVNGKIESEVVRFDLGTWGILIKEDEEFKKYNVPKGYMCEALMMVLKSIKISMMDNMLITHISVVVGEKDFGSYVLSEEGLKKFVLGRRQECQQ